MEWCGPGFDPAVADQTAIRRRLDGLAERLVERKTGPAKRLRAKRS
jgi:hypothetical protein